MKSNEPKDERRSGEAIQGEGGAAAQAGSRAEDGNHSARSGAARAPRGGLVGTLARVCTVGLATGVGAILSASGCAHTSPTQSPTAQTSEMQGNTHTAGSDQGAKQKGQGPMLQYPATRAENITETIFGTQVSDPYRWLEDVKSPEVQGWMTAQDGLARDYLEKLPGRDGIEKRLKELSYIDSMSAPVHRNGRYFYMRRHADKEKAVLYWKQGEKGAETVLIDPNTLSKDGSVALGGWNPSFDGSKLVYSLKPNNADEAWLYVMEVATGKVSTIDVIEGAKYAGPDWTPDGAGFYYTWLPTDPSIPASERPGYAEVRYHAIGTDPKTDALVHPKTGDPKTFLGSSLSRDGRWLFVYVQHGWNSNNVYLRDLKSPQKDFKPFMVGQPYTYSVMAWKDSFYIVTNEGAPRSRVFKVPAGTLDRSAWKEIVPESDAVLEDAEIVGGHLVLTYLRNAASELEIRSLDGKPVRSVKLPGIGTSYGMSGEPDEDEAYFSFMSFTYPLETYKTSIKTGETSLWYSLKVPVDPSQFDVEQVWYPSKDGTKVSMFIVRKKGAPKDGSSPMLLSAYGGFNVNMTPSFSASRFVWLEAGGSFAVPNLRGGGEYGEEWHKDGMLGKKQNVFDDMIASAEYLVKNGYTRTDRLAISGGSNGGLLMGAMLTQRPDLFKAVICSVPLLDMVRYHLFGSGRTWIPEYGTAENEADFKWIYAYSPYHRVVKGTHYPAMLMMSADSDDRVDPLHARKMVAQVQAAQASNAPILMRIEVNAGHGGGDMVKKNIEQGVDMYSFLMAELGMTPPAP